MFNKIRPLCCEKPMELNHEWRYECFSCGSVLKTAAQDSARPLGKPQEVDIVKEHEGERG